MQLQSLLSVTTNLLLIIESSGFTKLEQSSGSLQRSEEIWDTFPPTKVMM